MHSTLFTPSHHQCTEYTHTQFHVRTKELCFSNKVQKDSLLHRMMRDEFRWMNTKLLELLSFQSFFLQSGLLLLLVSMTALLHIVNNLLSIHFYLYLPYASSTLLSMSLSKSLFVEFVSWRRPESIVVYVSADNEQKNIKKWKKECDDNNNHNMHFMHLIKIFEREQIINKQEKNERRPYDACEQRYWRAMHTPWMYGNVSKREIMNTKAKRHQSSSFAYHLPRCLAA